MGGNERHLVLVPPSREDDRGASERAPKREEEIPTLEGAFRRYAPYVARVAMRLLGRRDEVEDAVQDVFVEASRGLYALAEPNALRGWLAAITVRVCSRRLRRRRVLRWVSLDDEPTYEDVASEAAPTDERVLLAQVYRILDTLPVAERIAWTLRFIEQERLEVVADRCGCSLATAKRRIAEAQRRLDKVIQS